MNNSIIRLARPGEEAQIHEAHMRSIREICIEDHGEEEVRGWGNRPLGNRWVEAIKTNLVWVIECNQNIYGFGFLQEEKKENSPSYGFLHSLYLTPEVKGKGLGYKLAMTILNKAKELNLTHLKLSSTITAYDFYRRLGFEPHGDKKQIDIGGYPVTCFPMIKKL